MHSTVVPRAPIDEQSKVFKSAEEALSSEELQSIMQQFEQEKQAIKKNLFRLGPTVRQA